MAESILAGTTVGAMGVRVSSTSKKAKAKEKAKGKSNRAGKKAATTTTTTTTTTTSSSTSSSSSSSSAKDKQPVDLAEVRKEISSIVGTNAAALTRAVMGEGLKGQLAPVKYLFEATGLYPATEISETKPDKESLAHTLMRNLKLPESPIVNEDDNEDGEDADSVNPNPAVSGDGQTKQPGGDSGTSADGKHSQGEEGTTAERAGDSVVE
ncbi:MAG: hypothetical protein ABR921_15370 [Candidatus Sulfotelmatobacter sp.]